MRTKRESRNPAATRIGMHRLDPVQRGGGIGKLAGAVVEFALTTADATEVEAQHGEAAFREHVEKLVDDLVVHRATELRVRVQDDRDRAVLLLGRLKPTLKAPRRAGENDFWHDWDRPLRVAGEWAAHGRGGLASLVVDCCRRASRRIHITIAGGDFKEFDAGCRLRAVIANSACRISGNRPPLDCLD